MAENGNLMRFSQGEARTNRHGNQLIELCKSIALLMINGRVEQDNGIGDFTGVDTTGRSTVDYMICNPEFLSIIHDFMIEPQFPESDHCGLSIKIHCKSCSTSNVETSYYDWASFKKYRWSSNDLLNLNYVMKDAISEQHREEFLAALSNLKTLTWLQSCLVRTSFKQWIVSAQALQSPIELNLTELRGLTENVAINAQLPSMQVTELNVIRTRKTKSRLVKIIVLINKENGGSTTITASELLLMYTNLTDQTYGKLSNNYLNLGIITLAHRMMISLNISNIWLTISQMIASTHHTNPLLLVSYTSMTREDIV